MPGIDFEAIKALANSEIDKTILESELGALRIKYLGRKGLITNLFGEIKDVPSGKKPEFGQALNILKQEITLKLSQKSEQLIAQASLKLPVIDITSDGIKPPLGKEHIINKIITKACSIFKEMGFEVVEGPEVETEFNNFTGLNIPLEHPSRDTFDTFYIKSQQAGEKLLLRSHTSPVQIRVMKSRKPPLAVVVPGKVYRPDATDASHSFMFHQIEGFSVGETITFSDLKGVLSLFLKNLFGSDIKMRFRPHFFPFTEPSVEVDISCIICTGHPFDSVPRQAQDFAQGRQVTPSTPSLGKLRTSLRAGRSPLRLRSGQAGHQDTICPVCHGKGWLEILGAGMIHPNVFKNVGYPAEKFSGFAFGMGIERITMLKYGINDIRLFFENDLRFLRQF